MDWLMGCFGLGHKRIRSHCTWAEQAKKMWSAVAGSWALLWAECVPRKRLVGNAHELPSPGRAMMAPHSASLLSWSRSRRRKSSWSVCRPDNANSRMERSLSPAQWVWSTPIWPSARMSWSCWRSSRLSVSLLTWCHRFKAQMLGRSSLKLSPPFGPCGSQWAASMMSRATSSITRRLLRDLFHGVRLEDCYEIYFTNIQTAAVAMLLASKTAAVQIEQHLVHCTVESFQSPGAFPILEHEAGQNPCRHQGGSGAPRPEQLLERVQCHEIGKACCQGVWDGGQGPFVATRAFHHHARAVRPTHWQWASSCQVWQWALEPLVSLKLPDLTVSLRALTFPVHFCQQFSNCPVGQFDWHLRPHCVNAALLDVEQQKPRAAGSASVQPLMSHEVISETRCPHISFPV